MVLGNVSNNNENDTFGCCCRRLEDNKTSEALHLQFSSHASRIDKNSSSTSSLLTKKYNTNMKFLLAASLMLVGNLSSSSVHGMVTSSSSFSSRGKKMLSSSSSSMKDNSNVLNLLTTARVIHESRSSSNTSILAKGLFGRPPTNNNNSDKWARVLFEEDELSSIRMMEEEEDSMTSRVSHEMTKVVSPLQKATQSEVPDMELLLQMEAARQKSSQSSSATTAAAAFIDTYDASWMERLAMSSIPSQLPRPVLREPPSHKKQSSSSTTKPVIANNNNNKDNAAADTVTITSSSLQLQAALSVIDTATTTAVAAAAGDTSKKTNKRRTGSTTATTAAATIVSDRVSHEEEIQLAHIIQRGVKLHNIKSEFEQTHGRDITRSEWTELAQLESPKELRRLVSTYRKAKNKLVTANMGLVHAVVRDLYSGRRQNGVTREELIQEGSLGLIRAAELFDPNRGLRFSTYAYIWIKGMLSNNKLDQTITLPAREQTKWNKIQKAMQDLKASSLEITLSQVAAMTKLTTDEVNQVVTKMTKTRNLLSLDYQYQATSRSGSDTLQLGNALMQDKNLQSDVDLVERLQLRADVIAALARNLDPREARLMRLRYGLKDGKTRTIVECAEAMGISRARAHQLANGCLKKLREADDAESLQEYLLTIA